MATYFMIGGVVPGTCPDPDWYADEGIQEIGKTHRGGIVRQGLGSGTYGWNVLTQAEFGDLATIWEQSKNGRVYVSFPVFTGTALTSWQIGRAAVHEPKRGRIEKGLCFNVTMRISEIGS